MRETGCIRIQAGISRAESRFARHDFATDGSIPRSGCEPNPAFRKAKALRIVRAMKGAQGAGGAQGPQGLQGTPGGQGMERDQE